MIQRLLNNVSLFIFVVGSIPQYTQNPVMMQQNTYMQQAQPQQAPHPQMYTQGQMPSGPYMNNQMLANSAK